MCKTMTISTLLDLYEDSPAFAALEDRTRRQYSYVLRRMADKVSNTVPINELTVPLTEGICAAMAANNGVHMAAALKRCSSAMFTWGVRNGYIDNNPWKDTKVAGVKARDVVWNLDDMQVMRNIAVSPDRSWREKQVCAIIYISYATAQRISDIKDLDYNDIMWQQRRLYMTQHKTGTRVSIPLTDYAWGVLAQFRPNSNGKLFVPMTDVQLSKTFARIRKTLGLPKEYCARDARRTRVVELIDAGCTEHEIMSWTGHKNSSSLVPYAAIHGREKSSAADAALAKLGGV